MAKPTPRRVRLQLWELDERIVPETTPTTSLAGMSGNLDTSTITNLLNSGAIPTSLPTTGTGGRTTTPTTTSGTASPAASPPTPNMPASPPPPVFASFLPDRTARPQVQLLSSTGTSTATLTVFDATYTGGVWTARADVTGDGKADTVAASGPGIAPTVAVFDALDNRLVRTITPYEPTFTGGVVVAAADLDGDGRAEIITGTDKGGGPRVRVFSGLDNTLLADFMAIEDPAFRGGVRVALGDVDGDGVPDLIATAGFGGGPRVAVFSGQSVLAGQPTRIVSDFFAFEPSLRDGVYPAAGKLDSDTKLDLLFGAGPGGAPRVLGISSARLLGEGAEAAVANPLVNFFAGLGEDRSGVRVGAIPNASGLVDLFTVDGNGSVAARYNVNGKFQGSIDRELALGSGLLADSTGQALTLGAPATTTGTGTTTPPTTTTPATNNLPTAATLQQLLNSLGLGGTSTIGGTGGGTNKAGG